MQAISIDRPGKISIKEIDSTPPQLGEVQLQINYVGICGSDLSTFMGKNPLISYPRIPGHEISATIIKVGANVPEQYKIGKTVTVIPYTNCGKCAACNRGRHNACEHNETLGVQRDGAMSNHFNVPYGKVLLADGLSAKELALVEPLTVGFHAVSRGRITESDTVMVLGCGMIGAGAIVGAAERGATVIAVDIDNGKLAIAKSIGATHGLNATDTNFEKALLALTDGFGPDVVIEAAGNAHTYRTAIEQVAFTGRVVCIGYAGKDISLPTHLFVKKEVDIMGSRNALKADFDAVITYLQKHPQKVEQLITKEIPITQFQTAMDDWRDNPGKVMKILTVF